MKKNNSYDCSFNTARQRGDCATIRQCIITFNDTQDITGNLVSL